MQTFFYCKFNILCVVNDIPVPAVILKTSPPADKYQKQQNPPESTQLIWNNSSRDLLKHFSM